MAAYFFVGMFERYLINIGNPTSVLFIFIAVRGLIIVNEMESSHRVNNVWRMKTSGCKSDAI